MSQDPLRSIRRHVPRQRRSFPDTSYLNEWLEPETRSAEALLEAAVNQIYIAHVVMLGEQRILAASVASRLLRYLTVAGDRVDVVPQHALARIHGHAVDAESRAMMTALAFEEVVVAASRIVLRSKVLQVTESLVDARASIADLASSHLTTLMLATSNGQVVQPTSLGHYLMGQLGAMGRQHSRWQEALGRLNRSPLGAVSGMSTAMPIRRGRVSELLGFDGVIENTIDAVAGTDVLLELSTIATGAAIDISRLVADLAYWARDDVGLLVPGDEFVHTGTAQPQRRDPRVIDHLRSTATDVIGANSQLIQLLSGQQGLGSDTVRVKALELVEQQLSSLERTFRLLRAVVSTVEVNRALFANRTNRGFATSSELADLLTIDFDVPRSDALELVERIVIEATEMGIDATTLTSSFVDQVALKLIGREIGIEPEMLARCLSPKRFVERRTATGSPSPRTVGQALERESFATRNDRRWIEERRSGIAAAEAGLRGRAEEVVSDPELFARGRDQR